MQKALAQFFGFGFGCEGPIKLVSKGPMKLVSVLSLRVSGFGLVSESQVPRSAAQPAARFGSWRRQPEPRDFQGTAGLLLLQEREREIYIYICMHVHIHTDMHTCRFMKR